MTKEEQELEILKEYKELYKKYEQNSICLNKENFGVGTNIIKCKNWLSILIKNLFNVDETKSFCQLNVYVPALVCDAIGIVYKALETSIFYDDIGSMGESEGAFSYKKHISSIKNMN